MRRLAQLSRQLSSAEASEGAPVVASWTRVRTAASEAYEGDVAAAARALAGLRSRHDRLEAFSMGRDPAPRAPDSDGRQGPLWEAEEELSAALQGGVRSRPASDVPWVSGAAHAHTLLRCARKSSPTPWRRSLALYLIELLVHRAAGAAGERPRVFHDHRPAAGAAGAGPSARAVRAEAHGALDPFAGEAGGRAALPAHMISRHYLANLKQIAADTAPAVRAHCMDSSAMFDASPYAPQGAGDDMCKRLLREATLALRARVEAGDVGVGLAPDGACPTFDPVRLVRRHLELPCARCATGDCRIWEVAAMAGGCPIPFYKGQRPTHGGGPESYPLTAVEQASQSTAVQSLVALGTVRAVESAVCVSPTFFVQKFRFAQSLAWAQEKLSGPGLSARLEEACAPVFEALREGPPSAAAVTRALMAQAMPEKPRLVFDYSTRLNPAGVAWPYAMTTIAEMLLRMEPGGWLGSVDYESGFHHMRVHPHDQSYMGFRDARTGQLYVPERLMFGLRSAPGSFCTVTAELNATAQRLVERDLGVGLAFLFVFIDDTFVWGRTEAAAVRALEIFEAYADSVGAKRKSVKTRPPAQEGPLLGLRLDTQRMALSLPADKKWSMLFVLHAMIGLYKRGVGLCRSVLVKLAGKLAHFCTVWPEGLPHLAPIYECTSAGRGGLMALEDCKPAVSALRYFERVLSLGRSAGALCIPAPMSPAAAPWVTSSSDAAGNVGFAVCVGPVVIWGLWQEDFAAADRSIGAKEAYAPLMMEDAAGDLLAGFDWFPQLDNLPDCFALQKGYTKDKELRPFLAGLLCSRRSGRTIGIWRPRFFNAYMDEASKTRVAQEVRAAMVRYRARG